MSEPGLQRQMRQHKADIDSLYELVEGVDRKVDALDVKLTGRIGALSGRMDELERGLTTISGQLTEVLRRLPG